MSKSRLPKLDPGRSLTIANKTPRRIFRVHIFLSPAGAEVYTLEGKPATGMAH